MDWWLNVFFLVNGVWVAGQSIDGWAPRAYESQAICLERKAFAEAECRTAPLPFETLWLCTPGAPVTTPPPGLGGVDC